ncbi:ABC transporter ATP-binding protein [Ensifer adhaerens]|uniref:ABC transporter ATP-binding protein n=1 Tax=Ensifer TaxID=106591 RepID=UPI001785B674|nr:ABC transporter ATP-binding protein [Ensifer sp. ENS08]MBD9572442.1 ABC transporter ATP-binding protein [Ensifer sp. ENS08]
MIDLILNTSALVAGYEPDLPIVRGVDFSVSQGELVILIGPNGAGKSTFVKAIAGMVPVHSGRIHLAGRDITDVAPHRKMAEGLAFVPQTDNVFASMTILENLQIAVALLPKSERNLAIETILTRFPDLAVKPKRLAGALSGGQRQMLAVARALALNPPVLILDEPSAGLSPKIVGEVFSMLKRINGEGVTIVLVEQNVKAAMAIADRAVILAEGQIRHEGTPEDLADDPLIGKIYLGTTGRAASEVAS